MKNDFEQAQNSTPSVTLYFGDIVKDNGEWKLEWNDPDNGACLLDEEQLLEKEVASRLRLDPKGDRNEWLKQRNINYSAEFGLARLQEFKMKMNSQLTMPYKPAIK